MALSIERRRLAYGNRFLPGYLAGQFGWCDMYSRESMISCCARVDQNFIANSPVQIEFVERDGRSTAKRDVFVTPSS